MIFEWFRITCPLVWSFRWFRVDLLDIPDEMLQQGNKKGVLFVNDLRGAKEVERGLMDQQKIANL